MGEILAARDARGCGARMSAGFCWPWSDAQRGEPFTPDVRIGQWARPWKNKQALA